MSTKDHLVQLTCPDCGHEDQAFDSDLRGARLVCDECGTYMKRDDGDDD